MRGEVSSGARVEDPAAAGMELPAASGPGSGARRESLSFNVDTGLARFMYGHPDGRRVVYVPNDGRIIGRLYQDLQAPSVAGNVLHDELAEGLGNVAGSRRNPKSATKRQLSDLQTRGVLPTGTLASRASHDVD